MQITSAQLKLIEDLLPVQRGNVTLSNLHVFNAILYVAEHGCKWRGLPKKFGNWHTIYTRANRWAKNGVLDHVFAAMQENDIINIPQKKDYIIMLGQFVNPGKIIFDSTLTVKDYINLAGGFGWRALEGDVRVIKAKTGEWIDADEDVLLQPGDTIWVPEDPPGPKFWEVFTDFLSVFAQVAAILAAAAAIIIATR